MRVYLLAAAFLAIAGCGETESPPENETLAAETGWRIDQQSSRLYFRALQTGKAFEGEFEDFSAQINFDPQSVETASIEVKVPTGSADTGDRQRDSALPGSDWFAVRQFPIAHFVSESVTRTGENEYIAHGRLTLRDQTRPLDLPFTLRIEDGRAFASGGATLIRTEFGVGQGEFAGDEWVGTEVEVGFDIEATKSP